MPSNFQNYIKELESGTRSNEKFKYTRFYSKFVMEDIDQNMDPEQTLKDCIQHGINRTIEESRSNNMEVDQIGVTISSILLDYDMYVPMRKLTENTTDAIINVFNKISQSKGRDGSLLGEPFTLTVTGVRTSDLPKTRQISGSGKKNDNPLRRKIPENSIIKIENNDR